MDDYLIYLLQVSVCHIVFYSLYKVVYEKLAWFNWNRAYILLTTLISFAIPLLKIGVWKADDFALQAITFNSIRDSFANVDLNTVDQSLSSGGSQDFPVVLISLFVIYLLGVLFCIINLLLGINKIFRFIRDNRVLSKEKYKIVYVPEGPVFFSFLNYIFVNQNKCTLNEKESREVLLHEEVHILQRHTYDLFILELASILCWFNPFIRKIKSAIVQVHEYQADKVAADYSGSTEEYSRLILELAGDASIASVAHQFSFVSVKNRINMLYQKNNNAMQKFRFLLAVPVLALLMAVFSCTEKSAQPDLGNPTQNTDQNLVINSIKWEGNELYSDKMLSNVMGVNVGEIYDREVIEGKISFRPEGDDIGALYMDNGYAYFQIDIKEDIHDDKVDVTFVIHEGEPAYINNITIKGNSKVKSSEVLKLITFKKGEPFSRSKLVESQKNLSESGWFVPGDIFVQPIPLQDQQKMDIEYTVKEM